MKNRVLGTLVFLVVGTTNILVGQEVVEFVVPTPGAIVAGLAAGPDGNIWFTENIQSGGRLPLLLSNGIWRISGTGAISEFHLSGGGGVGLAATAAGPVFGFGGSFWFAEASFFPIPQAAIEEGTPTGSLTQFDVTSAVSSLTYGPDGNIWFIAPATVAATATIGSITTSGVITTFDLPARSAPSAIAAGSDGNLWFTETTNNQVDRKSVV